jgi:hypothetical protein
MTAPSPPRTRHAGKLTVAVAESLLAHLRVGLFRDLACELVGISPSALKRWMRLGREQLDDAEDVQARTGQRPRVPRHAQLVIDVLAAEARTEARMLGVVIDVALNGATDRDRQSAATWWLERKRNLVYGSGALRHDLPRDSGEEYDGSTADADAEDLLSNLTRYVVPRRTPPTQ